MDTRTSTLIRSWLWALVPAYTLGFGTAAIMAHAAVRMRHLWQWLTVPLYVAGLVLVLAFDPDDGGLSKTLFGVGMTVNLGLGLTQALVIRGWVFPSPAAGSSRMSLRAAQRKAIEASREERAARADARELAAKDPALARELRIGRPDLAPRDYPDGGLVDVNHVGARVLTGVLGMPADTAGRIVEVRDQAGGFESFEDMALLVGSGDVDGYADRMVFVPPA